MSGTLALASAIAEMDRSALRGVVAQRRPQAAASITDPIGLATDLLRSDSITRAILPLDRAALRALLLLAERPGTADAAAVAALSARGLVGTDGGAPAALPEVTAVVSETLAAAGLAPATLMAEEADRPGDWPAADPAASPRDTDTWYSPAFTAVGQAAECLRVLALRPGKLNRNGTVAVVSLRALADATSIDVTSVSRILTALGHAGLTVPRRDDHLLVVGDAAATWLASDNRERWCVLGEAVMRATPPSLRAVLRATPNDLAAGAAAIPHFFPLLPEAEVEAAAAFVAVAEQLGLTVGGRLSAPAAALGAGELATARSLIAEQTPGQAPGVYVQPDLSVVVPGPLDPRDEAILSAISRAEQIGVASTRRITDGSIAEGIEQGVSPDAARELFARISLTGIPQPLEYLLATRAQRLGDLVVDEVDDDDGRTRITVGRPDLAETLLVDRSLQHLQLTRQAPTPLTHSGTVILRSRLRADHVISALTDARYHPMSGTALTSTRRAPLPRHPDLPTAAIPIVSADPPPSPPKDSEPLAEHYTALVERVHAAARAEPGTGDFTRRLELAIRDRSPVQVTAEARGQQHTFTLLPVSVTGGRLRATDQHAGVERTLPVSMITAVEPV